MKNHPSAIVVPLLLAAVSINLYAESYFVSPTGDDKNSGTTTAQPLGWIQTAINKSKSGDTIYLMPGTHTVKPGDRNISFSGKKGKEGLPITMTTTGPNVMLDLSKAEIGWGGFRICDGSEWIVVNGGGSPNPFDEVSFHLTIMNAGYGSATGDSRSGIVCRPVTIQGASHVIVRNIFGKRSMGGIGIFGQQTHNILVEKCRLQPGAHPHDGGASHGVYIGGGADDVLIKNTFIRWGGDDRLGVQNNHGGDKNIVLDECFITECQGAIKAINGGGVKVKNCWFWKIDENPGLQGNYTTEGLIYAPPSPEFIARLGAALENAGGTLPWQFPRARSRMRSPIPAPCSSAPIPKASKQPRHRNPRLTLPKVWLYSRKCSRRQISRKDRKSLLRFSVRSTKLDFLAPIHRVLK